jgi:Protein of unknown function (DUF3347)
VVGRRVVIVGLLGVLALAGAVRAAWASEPMKAIVAAYLDIQTGLVADKTDTIKARAHAIGEQAARMSDAGAALVKTAADLEKAADLKTMREAFGPLSDAVVAAAKADGWTDVSGLKLAYCPMVRHSWLQAQDTVQNPYLGKAMPGCGEFRKMQ